MREILDIIPKEVLIFFVISLVNVMLSTVKSVLTVKATKGVATLINAISYGFYAVVVKQLASLDLGATVTITILTNIIGVYISLWIVEKFKKDRLWKICLSTQHKEILEVLDVNEIPFTIGKTKSNFETYYSIEIYSKTQEVSMKIKNLINEYCPRSKSVV